MAGLGKMRDMCAVMRQAGKAVLQEVPHATTTACPVCPSPSSSSPSIHCFVFLLPACFKCVRCFMV